MQDKKIVLGVASVWTERKGFDDFIALESRLPENYQIVMVGVSEEQKKMLPDNVIGISRTNCVEELVQIYSAADVFLNLTYEDTYPTVNLEALACGTPVITYRTGGSPESVDETCGAVVDRDLAHVISALETLQVDPDMCIAKSQILNAMQSFRYE